MANLGHSRNIFKIFDNIYTARQIRQDPERRAKTVRYGVFSIIYAIVSVPCALTLFILPWMFGGEGILLLLFGIGAVAVGMGGVLIFTVNAILDWVLQISLNKRAVTWVALAFWIAALAACAVIAYFALSAL